MNGNGGRDNGFSLDRLLANARDGVFAINGQRQIVVFNSACEQLTGYTAEHVVGSACRCADLMECRDEESRTLSGQLCPGLEVYEGRTASARKVLQIQTSSGDTRWVEAFYAPIRGNNGKPELVLGILRSLASGTASGGRQPETLDTLRNELLQVKNQTRDQYGFSEIITRSPRLKPVLDAVSAAGKTSSPVLLSGEPGTGKQLAAHVIHALSSRRDGRFVAVECSGASVETIEAELFGGPKGASAGVAEDQGGLIQSAHGGTVFISSVDHLPPSTQGRLLQVIDGQPVRPVGGSAPPSPVDVRVIASTSARPEDIAAMQLIRDDLYHRLSVVTIEFPPLRERKEDVPLLSAEFVQKLNDRGSRPIRHISLDAWNQLAEQEWAANVQELQEILEAAAATCRDEMLTAEEIQAAIRQRTRITEAQAGAAVSPLDETLADVERRTIIAALRRANKQRSLAAKLMGISRSRLYRRMDALGIVPGEAEL